MNPFTVQGKAIPSSVRENIIESWLRGKGPTQIGKELRLQKKSLPTSLTTSFVEGIQKPKKEEIKLGLIGRTMKARSGQKCMINFSLLMN